MNSQSISTIPCLFTTKQQPSCLAGENFQRFRMSFPGHKLNLKEHVKRKFCLHSRDSLLSYLLGNVIGCFYPSWKSPSSSPTLASAAVAAADVVHVHRCPVGNPIRRAQMSVEYPGCWTQSYLIFNDSLSPISWHWSSTSSSQVLIRRIQVQAEHDQIILMLTIMTTQRVWRSSWYIHIYNNPSTVVP